jgi:hypothetical protein
MNGMHYEEQFRPGGKNDGGQLAMQYGERSGEEAAKYLWKRSLGEVAGMRSNRPWRCQVSHAPNLYGVVREDKVSFLVENVRVSSMYGRGGRGGRPRFTDRRADSLA